MKYKDICTKRTYTTNGQEKTIWLNVGTMRVTDDGKEYMELNMFPNTPFYVFEKQAKEQAPKPMGYAEEAGIDVKNHPLLTDEERNQVNEEDIDLSKIPF